MKSAFQIENILKSEKNLNGKSSSFLPVIYGKSRGHLLTNKSFHFHHSRKNSLFYDYDFPKFAFRTLFLEYL